MKRLLIFTAFIFITHSVFAQEGFINTSFDEATIIKKRILLVALPDESSLYLGQLAKENTDLKAAYLNDIAGQREALKKAIREHWTYNTYEFVNSYKEAKELINTHPDKYALLRIGEEIQDGYVLYNNTNTRAKEKPKTGWTKINDQFVYNTDVRYSHSMMGRTTLVIELPKRVMEVHLPNVSPTEGDFIFSLNEIQYLLSEIKKSPDLSTSKIFHNTGMLSNELTTKTLLLDKREMSCKVEDIRAIYPYPFLIVDYTTIENALITKNKQCIVLQGARYDRQYSMFDMCNAADGTIYGHITAETFKYGNINGRRATTQVEYIGITPFKIKQLIKK